MSSLGRAEEAPSPSEATPSAVAAPLPPWARSFTALRHRNYRLLVVGLFGALAGYWILYVAQGWLVLEITDSPFMLGLVNAALSLPFLFFSLLSGVLADRVDRRRLMMLTRSLVAVLMAVEALLALTDLIQVWHMVTIAFLTGTCYAFDLPARQALLPELVGEQDLTNAVALNMAVFNTTTILGPSVGGVLLDIIGVGYSFLLTGAGNLLLVFMLYLMTLTPQVRGEGQAVWRDVQVGLRFIRSREVIFTILIMAMVSTVFVAPYQAMMPVFAKDVLKVGSSGLGLLFSASGVGALIGSLMVAFRGEIERRSPTLFGAALVLGLALVAFSASRWLYLSLTLLGVVGASYTTYATMNASTILIATPDELRGRVMSVYMLVWGLTPVGAFMAGAISSVASAPVAVGLGGIVLIIVMLAILLTRPVMRAL